MAKKKSGLIVIRTHKTLFTLMHASSGAHWGLVNNRLRCTDFAHLAGQIGLTYEDLGKAIMIVDQKPKDIPALCKTLGVEYRDNLEMP